MRVNGKRYVFDVRIFLLNENGTEILVRWVVLMRTRMLVSMPVQNIVCNVLLRYMPTFVYCHVSRCLMLFLPLCSGVMHKAHTAITIKMGNNNKLAKEKWYFIAQHMLYTMHSQRHLKLSQPASQPFQCQCPSTELMMVMVMMATMTMMGVMGERIKF